MRFVDGGRLKNKLMNKEDWEKMNREDLKRQVAAVVNRYRQFYLPKGTRTYKNFSRVLCQEFRNNEVNVVINHQTIWNWENAKTLPRKDTLQLILFHTHEDMWQWQFANEILNILL